MQQNELDRLYVEVNKLRLTLEAISNHWKHSKDLPIILILLQNISGSSEGTVGYTLDRAVKETYGCIKAINAICDYHLYHVTIWIKDELDSILLMCRDYD